MSISGPKLMENDTFKTENVTLSSLSFRTIKVEDGYGSSEMSHAIATLHADRVQATATLKSEVKRDPYNPDHSNIGNSATLPTPDDAKPDTLVKNEADPTDTESDSEADNERDDDTYLPENADDSEEVPDGKIKRQRRQQAKDVREFVARLHEKEDERQAKSAQRNGKRESGHLHERSPKRAKTIGTGIVSKLQGSLLDEHQHSESLAPVMPEFTARTQKEQYQKLCNSIPEGSDLRRAKSQKTDLKGAMRLFRFKKIKVVNEAYKLDGMRSALQSFQLTASAWMIKRELGRNNPFGGILADDMGMGKTVMSLACIIGNPPIDIDLEKFSRSTLVITPNITVADQWLKEVGTHLEKSFSDTTVVFDPKRHSHSKELAERPIVFVSKAVAAFKSGGSGSGPSQDSEEAAETTGCVPNEEKRGTNSIVRHHLQYLRMAPSHPYNLERLLRNSSVTGQDVQALRNHLSQSENDKTILEQLLSHKSVSEDLEKYASGIESVRKIQSPEICGRFEFDELLRLIQNEHEAKYMRCGMCGEASMKFLKLELISLKSGGQSLNITSANRVIIIDPWWNVTAEEQAIGRVHRTGQEKVCQVVRIRSLADMDEKLHDMQLAKSEEVDYALQDDHHTPRALVSEAEQAELYRFTQGRRRANRGGRAGQKRAQTKRRVGEPRQAAR
ncbi:hypothetical protein UVI_02056280 [Ustilaginoidea virens]|uniref:Helicase C-terminal domain-containing protein n=1 Tax=Ustilaginoidea virens TaxID=1159556 RepID=A0A1B5L5X0_USTVR|nr:hypothetical protein UVI_02056280 [Ustilaginoidea virens]